MHRITANAAFVLSAKRRHGVAARALYCFPNKLFAAEVQESGLVEQLPLVMRVFVAMPYMHSEVLSDQEVGGCWGWVILRLRWVLRLDV